MRVGAAVVKRKIEAKLANRVSAALSPLAQQAPRLHPTGNAQLDKLLGNGLPLGSLCEVTGPEGSGRSSIALSLLAEASGEAACAYVDVSYTLSPQSAAAAGVELGNLLWVRFPGVKQAASFPETLCTLSQVPVGKQGPLYGGCGRSHPRSETKGLAPALEQMLFEKAEQRQQKTEGTPGHPNRPLGLHTASQEQVNWERWNLRKVDETDPLRVRNRQAADAARAHASALSPAVVARHVARHQERGRWDRLADALRVTDQVLQAGGFRVVVLDLAAMAPQQALRIPSATWFRFRRAAQGSDAILLLLTKEPCARSSAACVLQCSAGSPHMEGVLTAAPFFTEIARQRTGPDPGRKAPGRATSWQTVPTWMQAVGR